MLIGGIVMIASSGGDDVDEDVDEGDDRDDDAEDEDDERDAHGRRRH